MKPKHVKNHGPRENFLDEIIKTADKIMNRAEMGNRVSNLSPPEFRSFRDKILRGEREEPPVPAGGRADNRLAHLVGEDAFEVVEKNLPQMEKIIPGIVERVSQSREPLYTGYWIGKMGRDNPALFEGNSEARPLAFKDAMPLAWPDRAPVRTAVQPAVKPPSAAAGPGSPPQKAVLPKKAEPPSKPAMAGGAATPQPRVQAPKAPAAPARPKAVASQQAVKGSTAFRDITAEEGKRITAEAAKWADTPYVSPGAKCKKGADCSGSTWAIYGDAGFPLERLSSYDFPKSRHLRKLKPGEEPQAGDIGQWPGHVLIYDPALGVDRKREKSGIVEYERAWTAHNPKTKYGPASIRSWIRTKGPMTWLRYQVPVSP